MCDRCTSSLPPSVHSRAVPAAPGAAGPHAEAAAGAEPAATTAAAATAATTAATATAAAANHQHTGQWGGGYSLLRENHNPTSCVPLSELAASSELQMTNILEL